MELAPRDQRITKYFGIEFRYCGGTPAAIATSLQDVTPGSLERVRGVPFKDEMHLKLSGRNQGRNGYLEVMSVAENSDVAIDGSGGVHNHFSFCDIVKQFLQMMRGFKSVQSARQLQHLFTSRSLVSWIELDHQATTDSSRSSCNQQVLHPIEVQFQSLNQSNFEG